MSTIVNEISDYRNKLILAPMVRCTTLAFRLLALEYGADIVYTESFHRTIDYVVDGIQKPIFQTCDKERGKVVFQIGSCDAQRALKCAKLVENDVAAIDLNMGCPKEFSVQGGMGAALLKKPELVKEILTTLVENISKPITCKIRCLETVEETIKLVKMIEECGVKAVAVHGRLTHERSRQPNRNDFIREIQKAVSIPIIANGGSCEIKRFQDIEEFRRSCGASAVMLARVAMWNCSIFRREGTLSLDNVLERYLQICLETNNYFANTKYSVQQMLHKELTSERGVAVLSALADEEIYKIFSMHDELNEAQQKLEKFYKEQNSSILKRKLIETRDNTIEDEESAEMDGQKKTKEEEEEANLSSNVICMHAKFSRKDFRDGTMTPKSILHTITMEMDLPRPIYRTEEKKPERVFRSVVEVNNCFYTTPYWEPSKQFTEQAAAMIALELMGIDYKSMYETYQLNRTKNKDLKK